MEFKCPWCGENLEDLFLSMSPCSYDAVYEAHAPECVPFQQELNPGITEQSPPCDIEEE